ncbi:MAG TPA: helix-turn-helix transcriptional regulator [Candidatus Limnocylindria bacterium]|jgi:transcriptional regulator with XRE-family HTH domain|nr:helix-turn-helix transcriptional regulator [Candidatus Limnocylindria bacterium]
MANRRRALDEVLFRWQAAWSERVTELREARLMLGLTQQDVATALGVSRSRVCRLERRRAAPPRMEEIVRHAAAVGLSASLKFYPLGGAIRDSAQSKYIAEFSRRIGHTWRVMLDAPIPLGGDLRAVDVLLMNGSVKLAVEVITRLRDLQAQLRAAQLKQRDIGANRLIIVIAGSRANRAALAEARDTMLATFELDSRRVLAALAGGRDPGRDAVIVMRLAERAATVT